MPSDREAFVSFYDENFADVWRFARRRSCSSADADDVVAETFAVAWRRWRDVPSDGPRLWLFGVALRVIANQRRSTARQERLRLRLLEGARLSRPSEGPPDHDGALLDALAALSADDREVLIMRSWDGLGVTEMARLLACSPNAVSLRLHRARRRLRVRLEKETAAARHTPRCPQVLEGEGENR